MSIRTVLFDLGNVLLFFSHERMCRQIGQVTGGSPETIKELLFDLGLQRRIETGACTAGELHQELVTALNAQCRLEDLVEAASAIFEPNPPMIDLLTELKAADRRLVLLSNTCEPHMAFVRREFDFLDYFDAQVLSCRVGAMKPDSAIYKEALRNIDCRPEECFYTDDIDEYVQAARAFGIDAQVFVDAATCREQLCARGVLQG